MKKENKNVDPFVGMALAKQKQIFIMSKFFKNVDKKIKKEKTRYQIKRLFGF